MQNREPMPQARPLFDRLGDMLLTLSAVVGALCMLLVVMGLTMNVSLMMFRTGSMEPTIPAGSVAFVREIPATEIAIDDIITVDRGEQLLPITHRVTEITDSDKSTGAVTFVMQGDANDTPDPDPYTTNTVRRTFFWIPGIAPVISWFQNPWVLGGFTLGATILVIWAFWPRDNEEDPPLQRTQRGKHRAQTRVLPALLILTTPLMSLEQPTTTDLYGDYLRLRSTGDIERMTNMAPGDSATWVVDVWVDTHEPGLVELFLNVKGQLATHPNALSTQVTLCSPHSTVITECAPDSLKQTLQIDTATLASTQDPFEVETISSDETRRVLVTTRLTTAAPEEVQTDSATFILTAKGAGEELSITPNADQLSNRPPPVHGSPVELALSGSSKLRVFGAALIVILAGVLLRHARINRAFRREQ